MFNRPPGAMLSLGHTHQWRKGRNCSRVLSQHTAAIGTPTVTVCSIRAAGGTAFLQTEFNEIGAKLSPDSKWVAYTSNESGQNEVYVQTFPSPGGKSPISTGGGNRPVWRRDGRELFYIAADGKLMAVEVKT